MQTGHVYTIAYVLLLLGLAVSAMASVDDLTCPEALLVPATCAGRDVIFTQQGTARCALTKKFDCNDPGELRAYAVTGTSSCACPSGSVSVLPGTQACTARQGGFTLAFQLCLVDGGDVVVRDAPDGGAADGESEEADEDEGDSIGSRFGGGNGAGGTPSTIGSQPSDSVEATKVAKDKKAEGGAKKGMWDWLLGGSKKEAQRPPATASEVVSDALTKEFSAKKGGKASEEEENAQLPAGLQPSSRKAVKPAVKQTAAGRERTRAAGAAQPGAASGVLHDSEAVGMPPPKKNSWVTRESTPVRPEPQDPAEGVDAGGAEDAADAADAGGLEDEEGVGGAEVGSGGQDEDVDAVLKKSVVAKDRPVGAGGKGKGKKMGAGGVPKVVSVGEGAVDRDYAADIRDEVRGGGAAAAGEQAGEAATKDGVANAAEMDDEALAAIITPYDACSGNRLRVRDTSPLVPGGWLSVKEVRHLLFHPKIVKLMKKERVMALQFEAADVPCAGGSRSPCCTLSLYLRPNSTDIDEFEAVFTRQAFKPLYDYFTHNTLRHMMDAGANVGMSTLALALLNPRAEIVAVEPSGPLFKMLRLNTRNFQNVFPVMGAVWNEHAEMHPFEKGFRKGKRFSPKGVTGYTIPSLMHTYQFPLLDLVLFDAGGAEEQVLLNEDANSDWLSSARVVGMQQRGPSSLADDNRDLIAAHLATKGFRSLGNFRNVAYLARTDNFQERRL